MNIVLGAARAITKTAEATTAAAGALGGAAVNGVISGIQGTIDGARNGMSRGSHSTPAAALTLAAIGATGLIDWPILLGIGGTALVVRQLNQRSDGQLPPTLTAVPDAPPSPGATSSATRASKTTATRPTKSSKATKSAARTSTGRGRRSAAKR